MHIKMTALVTPPIISLILVLLSYANTLCNNTCSITTVPATLQAFFYVTIAGYFAAAIGIYAVSGLQSIDHDLIAVLGFAALAGGFFGLFVFGLGAIGAIVQINTTISGLVAGALTFVFATFFLMGEK